MNAWITSVLLVLSAGDAKPRSPPVDSGAIDRPLCNGRPPIAGPYRRQWCALRRGFDQSPVCRACFRD
jgi:hypothetical protein